MNRQTAIVTGGTSGIGLAATEALRARGCRVFTLGRRPFSHPDHIRCDVTDAQALSEAVAAVLQQTGRIDLLICCAGFGISGAFEYTDPQDARRQLDVNVLGTSNAMQAVLPVLRKQRSGRIVTVSSVAAIAPIPFQAWYSASKAALNALTMAVANEVRPYGVSLCTVLPGDIRTGFTAARKKSGAGDDAYGGRIGRSVAKMEKDERNGMDPALAGRMIARIALKRRVKPAYALGLAYKACALLIKLLPARTVRWLLGLLYGG